MSRRKYRERRNSAWERKWLQRELEASGETLDERATRRLVFPPSTTTSFDHIVVHRMTPAWLRRPREEGATVFN